MLRVLVRSRIGNLVLLTFGVLYTVGGFVVVALLMIEVWQGATVVDRILQVALLLATMCGVWLLSIAMQNLGIRAGRRRMPQLMRRSSGAHLSTGHN